MKLVQLIEIINFASLLIYGTKCTMRRLYFTFFNCFNLTRFDDMEIAIDRWLLIAE